MAKIVHPIPRLNGEYRRLTGEYFSLLRPHINFVFTFP
jgi:hypothetical protein